MPEHCRAVHGSGQTSRVGSGRVGSGKGDPTQPDPLEVENLLTRPDLTRGFYNFLDQILGSGPDPRRVLKKRECISYIHVNRPKYGYY